MDIQIKEKQIEEYLSDVDRVDEIEGDCEVIEGLSRYKRDTIHEKFSKIKHNLEEQENKITSDIEIRNSKKKNLLNREKEIIYEKIKEFKKKIKYLEKQNEIEKESLRFNEKEIKTYSDKKLIKLGELYKDNYLLIKLYIVENDKPKNKFSLITYGKTKFDKDVIESPYYYGLPTKDSGCYCNIRTIIKDLPTEKELQDYVAKYKDKILETYIDMHKYLVNDYLYTINNYTLKDFEKVLKPREVSELTPIVCIVDGVEWRLYNDCYYTKVKKIEGKWFSDYIKINGKLYKRLGRKELMFITQTGNTNFGNWWSMHLEDNPYQKSGILFTKENYEKTLDEAKQFIDSRNKNRRGEKISFSYPKIKWVNDYLIRDIEEKMIEI